MNSSNNSSTKRLFRSTARIIGTLAASFFLIILIGEMVYPHAPFTIEGALLAALGFFAIISILIAWVNERVGGALAIIAGVSLGIFAFITAGTRKIEISVFISLPFIIPGILFLISKRKNRRMIFR